MATIADPAAVTLEQVEANTVRCPDPAMAPRMIALIEEVRKDQDSIGGVGEMVATGVPAGLGEPVFDKLKADLARRCSPCRRCSASSTAPASASPRCAAANNDRSSSRGGSIGTETNRHGGMLGGISSGMPIVLRCAVKPTTACRASSRP